MSKKRVIWIGVFSLIFYAVLSVIYWKNQISITGITVTKSNITDVLILTRDGRYVVSDSKEVMELVTEVSKLEKGKEVEVRDYSQCKNLEANYINLIIQTKEGNIGGPLLNFGNSSVIESNGHFWFTSNRLFKLMDKSLTNAQKLN